MTQRRRQTRNSDEPRRIRELGARIAALERTVSRIESRVFPEAALIADLAAKVRPRRGRKPLIPSYASSVRNELVQMLEAYWPELQPFFLFPEKPANIRTVLNAI